MKYELTGETKEVCGKLLYRVRYLESGELGGWVESEKNLSQEGDARVLGNAKVSGNALVSGNAHVFQNAKVSGCAQVSGNAKVSGNALVFGNAKVSGCAHVSENAKVFGDAWEVSPLQIQGTKYFFSMSSKTSITVGCTTRTIDEWLSCYEHDFEVYLFTEKERIEYKFYFNLAVQLYGLDVPLLPIEGLKNEVTS
jgi:formylmethanofuran dehydrogenase subunit C